MGRVQEYLKKLWDRILAWWGKFTTKQKTLIISVTAGVVVALVIVVTLVRMPQYTTLIVCDTTKQTSEVKTLLDDNNITYKISADGLTVTVLKGQMSDATILLGANDIPTAGYDISNVFSGGFSTTEADKEKKYKLYLEQHSAENLEDQDNIENATVNLSIPENDGTLLSDDKESYASIMLTLKNPDDMNTDVAASLARFVATAIGNDTTDNIVIMDSTGSLLFSGENESDTTGVANTRLSYSTQYDNLVKGEIKDALVGAKIYDNVQVVPNLDLNWDKIEKTEHTYTPADGQDQGLLSHEDTYSQSSTNGSAQVPGTDTNGEGTYVYQDNANSTTTTDEDSKDYVPNETITTTTPAVGAIKYDSSSIGITAIHYVVYNEDDMKAQGLLDGTTFEEYKAANGARTKGKVDDDVYSVVSKATGVPVANIQIVAYEEPVFVESQNSGFSLTNIFIIGLIILILGLLAFVVIRSMRAEKQPDTKEELSLDNLLQSTQDQSELEAIDTEGKSEVRLMIEKFVDENPEAVASLLRNWLSEDWG